jgi:uncharacterized protein involved in outer membrane biogenesis
MGWWRKRLVIVTAVFLGILIALAVTVRILLGGDRIKAAVESQASAALGHPVAISAVVPRLLPRIGLELTGITVGAAREVTIEEARLTTGFRALLGGRVEDAEVSVERSRIDVRWALALLAALADSAPRATASAPSGLTIESIGSIALTDVTLIAGSRQLLVDLDSSLSGGDRLLVRRIHGRSEGSDLVISGELSSVARRTGTFTIEAQTLDLDGLMAFLAAATPAGARQVSPEAASAPPPAIVPLQLEMAVRARKGSVLGIAFTNLETAARMAKGALVLDGLKMEVFGGRFAGTAGFDGAKAVPAYEWRGTFERLDVPALVAFAGSPGSMTGRLAGSVALAAAGVEPVEAMRRARGTARVVMTDGRIPGLELVRSVVLAFGKPSGEVPGGSGEAFTRLAASLVVDAQALSTNDLTLASRDLDLTGKGTLSLATQAVDLHTDVRLSRELSAQAGRDLYRLAREGDRIVLPARITGTVASPTVFVDVASALRRALRNRFEDEVKSLFDRWRKKN